MVEYYWNPKTGRYHDRETNVFVRKAKVAAFEDRESVKAKAKIKGLAKDLVGGRITLQDFQTNMISQLKESHIRMGLLASGGKDGISNNGYLGIARTLKQQYKYLNGFAKAISNGELSEKQIIARAGMYARSFLTSYSQAELISRKENGVQYAKRLLDAQADHCDDCIRHERRDWTPIEDIVPRGTNCRCHHNCKCNVVFAAQHMNPNLNRISRRLVELT